MTLRTAARDVSAHVASSAATKAAQAPPQKGRATNPVLHLQRTAGNRAVQRLVDVGGGATSRAAPEVSQRSGHATAAHDAARSGTRGSGIPLPHVAAIQRSFGRHDVTHVVAHADGAARAAARELGAEAFAVGEHVAFRSAPHLRAAAHEAAHVVQQRSGVSLHDGVGRQGDAYERHADAVADGVVQGSSVEELLDTHAGPRRPAEGAAAMSPSHGPNADGSAAVQRLVKDSFPWNGVIVHTRSASLRSSPKKDPADPHANTLADLPKGTRLLVVGRNGYWLQVEVDVSGKKLTGYLSQELVDDATASQLEGMLGTEAQWTPSEPGSGNSFEKWASAASEGAAPALGPGTTINCWEMILYSAHKTKAIPWSFIHDLYVNQPIGAWVSLLTKAGTGAYTPGTSKLRRGDLVFFDGLAHVALATGKGDEIYTFWPPPNTPFSAGPGGTVDKVKTSTVAELSKWMKDNFGAAPTLTFGAPAW